MSSTKKVILLCFCFIILFGCSSKGSLHFKKNLNAEVDRDSKVAVYVHPHDKVKKPSKEFNETIQTLKNKLFGRLVSDRVFSQVVNYKDNAKYKLDVSLLSADEVPQSARIVFGVLAGSNELKAQVQLINIDTGEKLTEFITSGESASHPLSSENDMESAVNEVTDNIISALI